MKTLLPALKRFIQPLHCDNTSSTGLEQEACERITDLKSVPSIVVVSMLSLVVASSFLASVSTAEFLP